MDYRFGINRVALTTYLFESSKLIEGPAGRQSAIVLLYAIVEMVNWERW